MNSKIKFLLFFLFAFVSGCGPSTGDKNKEYQRYEKSANSYFQSGQLKAAVVEAHNMIRQQPENINGYKLLSELYLEMGAYEYVRELLTKKLVDFPSMVIPLARADFESRKFRSCIELLDKYPIPKTDNKNYISQIKLKAMAHIELGEINKLEYDLGELQVNRVQQSDIDTINAYKFMSIGEFNQAISLLKPHLNAVSNKSELLLLLANAEARMGELDKSEGYLTLALSSLKNTDVITADRSKILSQLIEVLIKHGKSAEAYVYQKLLADKNPEAVEAQRKFNQAAEFYQQGDFFRAQKIIEELRLEYPKVENAALLEGLISFKKGDDENANNIFNEFLDLENANENIIQAAALVKMRINKTSEALNLLEHSVEAQPRNTKLQAAYGLALLSSDIKNTKGASALEKSLAADRSQDKLKLILAKHYFSINQSDLGLAVLKDAYQVSLLDQDLQKAYFSALYHFGHIDEMQLELKKFKNEYPESVNGIYIEGWVDFISGNYSSAINNYKMALTRANGIDQKYIYLALSQAYIQQGNAVAALEALQDAITKYPDSFYLYSKWFQLFQDFNKKSDALKFLSALENNESGWIASIFIAKILASEGAWSEAELHMERAVNANSKPIIVGNIASTFYFQWSDSCLSSLNIECSEKYLLKSLSYNSNNFDSLLKVVFLKIKYKKINEAKEIVDRFSAGWPDSSKKLFFEGIILAAENKYQEALSSLTKSWDINPDEIAAENIYQLHNKAGDVAAAKMFLHEWSSKFPKSYKPAFYSAMRYQAEGQRKEAIVFYEKTLVYAPNLPAALNNLAWLYYEAGDQRAIDVAKRAYIQAPESVEVMDTLGWILVQNGAREQGLELLKKASEKSPANKEIKRHFDEAQKIE